LRFNTPHAFVIKKLVRRYHAGMPLCLLLESFEAFVSQFVMQCSLNLTSNNLKYLTDAENSRLVFTLLFVYYLFIYYLFIFTCLLFIYWIIC